MFAPFDDTKSQTKATRKAIYRIPPGTKQNYDTTEVDKYRQGTEITLPKYLDNTSEPKIWSGDDNNFKHTIDINTYGQSLGFIDNHELQEEYKDLPNWNPVTYIQTGNYYPKPILVSQHPSAELEAQIEPLTIPDKLPTNEGPYYAHDIHASLQDGNDTDDIWKSTNKVIQFIPYKPVPVKKPFVDEGGGLFGSNPGYITLPHYSSEEIQRLEYPFDELLGENLKKTINTNDTNFLNAISNLKINNYNDIRPLNHKSSTAGYDYYGGNSAIYGTDSITFGGWWAR